MERSPVAVGVRGAPMADAAAAEASRDPSGIVVTFVDVTAERQCYSILEKALLKILSQTTVIPNPEAPKASGFRLNDRMGLWPADVVAATAVANVPGLWHRLPYLCLYLVLIEKPEGFAWAEQRAAIGEWVKSVQATGAGQCVAVVVLDSPTIAVAPVAAATWKKQFAVRQQWLAQLAAQSANVVEIHPVLRPAADRYSILRRDAEPLAALLSRELGLGFSRRIARYREELSRRELSNDTSYVETLEGLAFVFTKLSLFSSALLLYDDWELLLDRHRAAVAEEPVKQRCAKCHVWFTDGTVEPCRYHSGQVRRHGRYDPSRWSCCNAVERDAQPCVLASTHTVDAQSARLLSRTSLASSSSPLIPLAGATAFRLSVASPSAPLLDPSSHLPVALVDGHALRQYLLARQCRLLASMGQLIKLGRRLLRFVTFASRSSKAARAAGIAGAPLELEAWCYRVCLEAVRILTAVSPTALAAEDDPSGRAVVLGRLYQTMRVALSVIGVAWFAQPPSQRIDWDGMLQDMEDESEASSREVSVSSSSSELSFLTAGERAAMRVSVLQQSEAQSLDDPWFIDADCELDVPRGRFPGDTVSPLLTSHRGLRAMLGSRASIVDALRRLAGRELLAWQRAGRERMEMSATVELARVYFDLSRFDEAQLLIRAVLHKYADSAWTVLYAHCLVLLAECELRLHQKVQCASTCLQLVSLLADDATQRDVCGTYAIRVLKLVRLFGVRPIVRPLESILSSRVALVFVVLVYGAAPGDAAAPQLVVTLQLRNWPVDVTLDRVVVELVAARDGDAPSVPVVVATDMALAVGAPPCELRVALPAGGDARHLHKLLVEIGSLHLVQLLGEDDRGGGGGGGGGGAAAATAVAAQPVRPPAPPLSLIKPHHRVATIDDALLPSVTLRPHGCIVACLRNDAVAELALRMVFKRPLVECTLWVTCGRLSLVHPSDALLPPSAVLVRSGVQLSCMGREDDAVVITGSFQAGDEINVSVPLRARQLLAQHGPGTHQVEVILACRPLPGGQAHAAFRHVAVSVTAPFSHLSASLISAGAFRHLVVRIVCNVESHARELRLELPKELFLVSSDCSHDLGAGALAAGTVVWFRYCIAQSLEDEQAPHVQPLPAGTASAPAAGGLQVGCVLELEGMPYRFAVDLRSDYRALPSDVVDAVLVSLLDGAFAANSSADADVGAARSSTGDTRTLLDLRGNVFGWRDGTLVATSLRSCSRVVRLILENCEIGTRGALALAESLSQCAQLQTLNLYGNSIGTEGIVALCFATKYLAGGLHELDLGHNDCSQQTAVVSLSSLVAASPRLHTLRLWRCHLRVAGLEALTTAFGQENALTYLDLGNNAMDAMGARYVSAWLATNPRLASLSLWYNHIGVEGASVLALALHSNSTLRTLDLRDNGLPDQAAFAFAALLRSNVVLTELQLQDNLLGEAGIFELAKGEQAVHHENYVVENLLVVENSGSALESLPHLMRIASGMKRNRSFKEQASGPESSFVVTKQALSAIPPQVGLGAERLTVLSLEYNEIRTLSSGGLVKLTALTALNLSHNQLTAIGPELNALRELLVLRLEGNAITRAPAGPFTSLALLQTLDLSGNRLEEFPECVCVLPQLMRLNVSRNAIASIPASYPARMVRLLALDVSHNRLQSLPPDVALMTALRVLHVNGNALEMLPASLGRIEWDSFHVEDNPLSCIPASTVSKGSRAVQYYLRDLLSGSEYFYRCKLLVTGQANVGKTTLLSALKNEVGNVNKVLRLLTGKGRRSSTSGIALEDWKPHNSIITFSTWDFGGQLVYYTTHQFFLSKRALYLLVFSMARGLQEGRLISWLNSIQSRAPGVPVMLVGTHRDDKKRCTPSQVAELAASVRRTVTSWERSFPSPERLNILKNTDDCWFFPVSAITGEGVPEIRSRLLDVAADQPSLRERVPLLYLKLLDVVRVQRRAENLPITTWTRFREWAGFEDESQLERAVQLLHDWGELLWFSESAALRDVVVLSPQWLTAMFATIIATTKDNDDNSSASMAASSPSTDQRSSYSESENSMRSIDESEDAELGVLGAPVAAAASRRQRHHRRGSSTVGVLGAAVESGVGVVERSELPQRWSQYDSVHYPFFETLLERFELWIPIDDAQRFLVPCLLPRRGSEEDVGLEWDQVRFGRAFTLPFPLHGLFERCLVQLHRLYSPRRYWRGEALIAGPASVRIFTQLRDCSVAHHPHAQRLAFYFAALPADTAAARSCVASVMFVVHNFLQDWYNASLREQVLTEALCPRCCSAEQFGAFDLEHVLRVHVEGAISTIACPLCAAPLLVLDDLVPEMLDPVHARSNYASEMEELRHIADGAFSRVHQARWRGHEIVAVKKLRVQSITVTWFLEFLQEINMLQELRHANLVAIRAAYLRPLCIVLEWVGGGTLDQAIARFDGPHEWDLLMAVLRDVAVGMAFLHSQTVPVLHRDLKYGILLAVLLWFILHACSRSMNILVVALSPSASPCVKIADLGSSCHSLGKVSGRVLHNPRWKPPELFRGSDYTAESDVYCFSLIMWELPDWPSLIEDRILLGERPSLANLSDVRADYLALMQRCWAQVPRERPRFDTIVGVVAAIAAAL